MSQEKWNAEWEGKDGDLMYDERRINRLARLTYIYVCGTHFHNKIPQFMHGIYMTNFFGAAERQRMGERFLVIFFF